MSATVFPPRQGALIDSANPVSRGAWSDCGFVASQACINGAEPRPPGVSAAVLPRSGRAAAHLDQQAERWLAPTGRRRLERHGLLEVELAGAARVGRDTSTWTIGAGSLIALGRLKVSRARAG